MVVTVEVEVDMIVTVFGTGILAVIVVIIAVIVDAVFAVGVKLM